MNDNKISAPKSLHMSINLFSHKAGEITPSTTKSNPINEKIGDSKLGIGLSKTSPETPRCKSLLITLTQVSIAGVAEVVSLTPQSDTKMYLMILSFNV